MNTENIYQPPSADLSHEVAIQFIDASRGARLGASIIDGIAQIAAAVGIYFLIIYISGSDKGYFDFFEELNNTFDEIFVGLITIGVNIVIFLGINGLLLITQGQTIGKKLVGIHIVNERGEIPDALHIIGLRFIVITLVGLIPFMGNFFGLIDVLFIFGAKRLCLHDYLAGTRVIDKEATNFETDYAKNQKKKETKIVEDSVINSTGIEYSNYTKQELEETLSAIDEEEHPERAAKIKLALQRFE